MLALGAGYGYFVLRPALQIKNALRIAAATQVGQTSAAEFKERARNYGLRVDEGMDYLAVGQRNQMLEFLHLAPQTIVAINAKVSGGIVTLLSVRAWVGKSHEYANIDIENFDTRNTGCGAVSECIKPYSSTMLTSVFFVPNTPLARRQHLLSLNYWCLAKIGGCKSSREFFPAAWENEHP